MISPDKRVNFNTIAREQHDKKALLVTDQTLAYGELELRIRKLTTLFAAAGLQEGSRVVLTSHHDQVMTEIFLALLTNGITAVIVDPDSTNIEANGIIDRAEPAGIIADKKLWTDWELEPLAEKLSFVLRIADSSVTQNTLLGKLLKRKQPADESCYPDILKSLAERQPPATVGAATTAYILFTSGTTSAPKGVEISCGALFTHLKTLSSQFSYDTNTRILNVLPLSHVDGLVQGPVVAYFNGASVYRPCRFSAQTIVETLDTIYSRRITHMVAVPTMLAMMSRLGKELREFFAGDDFRFIISAAAYLEQGLWENIEGLTRKRVVNLYGLTETVTGSLFNGPDDSTRRVGTLGKPVDCEVRLVDAEGIDAAQGESGELLIRGQHLMSGYFRDSEASAETLKDGWLYTGDLVSCDADGFYHYVGRSKNIIISGGLNIIPEQVSTVLLEHPDVAEAVVVGLPEPDWGEVAVAYVVPEKNKVVDTSDLIEFCRNSLTAYKVPHRIVRVPKLPRGRTGKVKVAEVRAFFGGEAASSCDAGSTLEGVFAVAADIFQTTINKLSRTSDTNNTAGWDSLGHMHFIAALEKKFAVMLTTRDIITINSLDQAINIIEERKLDQ